jgi:hypothetical protein
MVERRNAENALLPTMRFIDPAGVDHDRLGKALNKSL